MEEIVAEKGVAHAGLLGRGFQRRMGIDHAHVHQEAAVGNAVEAGTAVVVRDILYEPVDRVVGIGALVDSLGILRIVNGAEHHEFAFGAIAPANVLEHKDVAIGVHLGVAADILDGNAVGGALEEDWERARDLLGCVDLGVELHSVAHGNHDFFFVEEF